MADTSALINVVTQNLLLKDPSAAQRIVLNAMEAGYNIRTVDASNPWALQIEASITTGVGIVEGYRNIEQRLYPSNALTYDDLYRHMSDVDYITVFSKPSETRLDLYLRKDEVILGAVDYGVNNAKRLVIPKNTVITAGDYNLNLYNAINIDVTQNKGIRINWDMGTISPLKPLNSNEVLWDTRKDQNYEYIRIRIPVEQVTHTSRTISVSASTGFSHTFTFTDQYYYARVYTWFNNEYLELLTTHTDQVYDITRPTAVLKVFDNSVQVVIPTIYFTNNIIGSSIRVDIFSTRGDVRVAINEYESGQFSGKFIDYDQDNNVYISAFNNLSTKLIMAVDPLSGGSNRVTFDELRELVIMNATGPQSLPITPAQLQRAAKNNGYDIVKNIDSITNRVYLASRDINPDFNLVDGFSPLSVTMGTLKSTFNELVLNSTVSLSNTSDRITIKPKSLFKQVNGITYLVPDAERTQLENYTLEQLLLVLNNNTYLFTPYYYVLDAGEARFRTRVYDLDSPSIPTKNFVTTNAETGVEVTAVGYEIQRVENGYRLLLITESNDLFKEIIEDDPNRFNCQLSFLPNDGSIRTFINSGLLKDVNDDVVVNEFGEFFIEFLLDSDFDVTEIHGLYLTSFSASSGSTFIASSSLTQVMDLVYIVDDITTTGLITTGIDYLINDSFLDPGAINHVGITHDQITLKFGDHLEHLWTRSKTSVTSDNYLTYEEDIPFFYDKNVYQYGVSGSIDVFYDIDDAVYKNVILHHQNDPELEETFSSSDTLEIISGSDTLMTSSPVFTIDNVGDYIIIPGGTAIGNGRLVTKIASFISSDEVTLETTVALTVPAGTTITYGVATLKHVAGNTILDINGDPISNLLTRDLDRETDILMFDGVYYFATHNSTVLYKNTVKNDITRWVTEDIHSLSLSLLEQTELYFYPKKMIGGIEVFTIDNTLTVLGAKQSLNINVYVDTETFKNNDLKLVIERTLSEHINREIRKTNISLDTMTSNLLTIVGNNVKALKINNLFSNQEYIITLKDASYQFSIGKQAIGLSDGSIAVKDALTYQFFIHDSD